MNILFYALVMGSENTQSSSPTVKININFISSEYLL